MELNLTRPLAFLDLETTGTNITRDRIVEICILKVNPDGSKETKLDLVDPGIPIPPAVTAIHGISDADVKNKKTFPEIAKEYADFIFRCDLCGYNAIKFDIPLLVEEFSRAGVEFEYRSCRIVDVQNIFHKMEPRTLKAAYKFYCSKDLDDAHTAEADTLATHEILLAQLDRYYDAPYEAKDGTVTRPVVNNISSLAEFSLLARHVDLVGHIIYNDKEQEVFNFGKHKGRPVAEVFRTEPAYYDWMMKSDFPHSTKIVITELKLKGFNKGSVNIH